MKKIIALALSALLISSTAVMAQSSRELAQQSRDLTSILKKVANEKPSKEAKKLAKNYEKEGWKVPMGEHAIAQQVQASFCLNAERILDENGTLTPRFITQTSNGVATTYNAAYAAARANALTELATSLGTELAAAVQAKLDNDQQDAVSAITVDKFDQRMKAIVHQSLTNAIPVNVMYRELPNRNYDVFVRLAFDKQELTARIKRALRQELELQGDQLNKAIENTLNSGF